MKFPRAAGTVSNVRELTGSVQAEIVVGSSGRYGHVVITVHGRSPEVQRAMQRLKGALKKEAADLIQQAREDERNTAREILG